MLQSSFAVYLGEDKEIGFSGFLAEGNLFLVIDIDEGISSDQGHQLIQKIKDSSSVHRIQNLADFEQFILGMVKDNNLPSSFSIAAGYLKEKIFYLKTVGEGKIFLQRTGQFAKLIEGNNSASGFVQTGDFFIFTIKRFIDLFGNETGLESMSRFKRPNELVDELTPKLKGKDDRGAIALFVRLEEKGEEKEVKLPDREVFGIKDKMRRKILSFISSFFSNFNLQLQIEARKKRVSLLIVLVVFFILVLNLISNYKKNVDTAQSKKLESARQIITLKLNQAEDVAFINLDRSLALITEAREEISNLKKQLGKSKIKQLTDLESLINEKENKIIRKEERNYEEFYDLTLGEKNAQGTRFYLEDDIVAILDKKNGNIYLLSLTKKSLSKKSALSAKRATLLAYSSQDILFLSPLEGIYKISSDGEVKKVIDQDKDWGDIADMFIYNGNIYLLDKGRDEVLKYIIADKGYSEKVGYFKKGEGVNLQKATSLVIDSSVYIGFTDQIIKYTAGVRDEFSSSFPQKDISLAKIFTNKNLEKIYAWSKKNGCVYILGKNGTYERQVKSPILLQASDFIVFNNVIYVLVKDKIYKIMI